MMAAVRIAILPNLMSRVHCGPGRTGLVAAGVEDTFSLSHQHAARPYRRALHRRYEPGMLCDDESI